MGSVKMDDEPLAPWRDPTQKYDSKSREYAETFGIDRHEPLYFHMSPARDDQDSILRRMVGSIRTKGVGSFAVATVRDRSYRVDVAEEGLLVSVTYPAPKNYGCDKQTDTWWWHDD